VSPTPPPTIAVVGAGMAGLSAAWELIGGTEQRGARRPVVHVLEAGDRVGGKLRSGEFAGRTVDLAADAFVARRPEATDLCQQLGLADQLVVPGTSGASIWARGRLRAMPDALNVGIPTRWWPLFRSGVLTPAEALAAARDVVVPHLAQGMLIGDRSVGEIVGERMGRPVVERLVDPLIGGINAGNVDELSAAAAMPVLIAASLQSGSLMHRLGRVRATGTPPPSAPDGETPVFRSLQGSTASLPDQLAEQLARRGVTIRTRSPVEAIESVGSPGTGRRRWRVVIGGAGAEQPAPGAAPDGNRPLEVDGLVLAAPAPEAAVLLVPHLPVAAGLLAAIQYASVAVVTLSVPAGAIRTPLRGTGFLVPRTSTIDGRQALITGCTYLGRKWPHLARPRDELIRVSAGRFGDDRHRDLDDDQLTASVFGELAAVLDISGSPLDSLVTRWRSSFPQYQVGHLIRVAEIEKAVSELGGMAVAGAALRGVGIPACIASGRQAAQRVLASVGPGPGR
jgi:oxygen-dependent protoporphyrinogen oxidase